MRTIAAFVAGLALGGSGVALAASTALYDLYPRDGANVRGLDVYCSYQPARAGVPRVLICGRDSTNLRGAMVGITARDVRIWDSRRPARTTYRLLRNP